MRKGNWLGGRRWWPSPGWEMGSEDRGILSRSAGIGLEDSGRAQAAPATPSRAGWGLGSVGRWHGCLLRCTSKS